MRKLIIAALPTVLLSKLKIIKILYLDFFQNNILRYVSPETVYNKPLYVLECQLLYLLQNMNNPNIELLKDVAVDEIMDICENYYNIISDEYELSENKETNFKINENAIRHEIQQLLNDIYIIYDTYCYNKKIIGVELLFSDRVYLEIIE